VAVMHRLARWGGWPGPGRGGGRPAA